MNREQAKELLPIIQAFVKGKTIEFRERGCTLWTESISPIFNFAIFEYRIKSEPKYRPFKDADECWQEMQKHQPFGWVKGDCGYENISIIRTKSERPILINIEICGKPYENSYNMSKMLRNYTFADGTPFGIKEE